MPRTTQNKTKKTEAKPKTPRKKAVKKEEIPQKEVAEIKQEELVVDQIAPEVEEIGEGEFAEGKPGQYYEAVGRRKTAVARVRLFTRGDKEFLVNEKPYDKYFATLELQQTADAALRKMKCLERFRVSAKVNGGGLHSQAEAVRHGTSRALVEFNLDFRKRLKKSGYLTRDPRMRERKKFGLKRARRAPQWQKR